MYVSTTCMITCAVMCNNHALSHNASDTYVNIELGMYSDDVLTEVFVAIYGEMCVCMQ